jgi:hypothetical protein
MDVRVSAGENEVILPPRLNAQMVKTEIWASRHTSTLTANAMPRLSAIQQHHMLVALSESFF